jgi:integrase
MSRKINRLTARSVAATKKKGLISDGGGLYLQTSASGSKSWVFRFMLEGRTREMGLGAIHTVSLADARDAAERCRKLLHDGSDPIELRKRERGQRRQDSENSKTFKECADAYIRAHRAGWKNAKHASQWENTLTTYAYPIFNNLPVSQIDTTLVQQVLEPIWTVKTETASRVRSRIEAVLDWATVQGFRSGENPARWRGHLQRLLPARTSVRAVVHQRALPYEELGNFMQRLRALDGIPPRALEFQILTAVRPGEALGACWSEIDLGKALWVIPGARMKGGKRTNDHQVPLSAAALAVLDSVSRFRCDNDFVFPSNNGTKALGGHTPMSLLKRMGLADRATAHGFRSTFRDWGAERTAFPHDVLEMALAHKISNKVEAAYRRGSLLDKRRQLMQAWANFSDAGSGEAENVVQIGAA